MNSTKVIMQPTGLGTVDQIGDDSEGVGMMELCVDDIGDGIIVKEYLRHV